MQANPLVADLRRCGYDSVATHVHELLSGSKNSSVIPFFGRVDPATANPFTQKFMKCVFERRKRVFAKHIINKTDIQVIERILGSADEISYEHKVAIEEKLGSEKASLIFSHEIPALRASVLIPVLRLLAKYQLGARAILSQDSEYTDSVHILAIKEWVKRFACRMIDALAQLSDRHKEFVEFYVSIVVSRFKFAMSGVWMGRFSVAELLSSIPFRHFVCMDEMELDDNPLTIRNTIPIYRLYTELDSSHEGLLSQSNMRVIEMGPRGKFRLSDAFISRLFEMMPTFNGKLDFDLFLEFYWMLWGILSLKAAQFFHELFDLDCDGRVGVSDLRFFYKSLDAPSTASFDWFMAEIYDRCQCREEGFTVDMLQRCSSEDREHVIRMIIDVKEFADESSAEVC